MSPNLGLVCGPDIVPYLSRTAQWTRNLNRFAVGDPSSPSHTQLQKITRWSLSVWYHSCSSYHRTRFSKSTLLSDHTYIMAVSTAADDAGQRLNCEIGNTQPPGTASTQTECVLSVILLGQMFLYTWYSIRAWYHGWNQYNLYETTYDIQVYDIISSWCHWWQEDGIICNISETVLNSNMVK